MIRFLFQFQKERDLGLRFAAASPEIYKLEFEQRYLHNDRQTKNWRRSFRVSWNLIQRMLIEIQMDPVDWYDDYFQFYDYFCARGYSHSYVKKTILVLNLWGQFLAKKLGQDFTRVPPPRGAERARIFDSYFRKIGGKLRQSDPLSPEQLDSVKNIIKPE